jgi:hypothetical protein
MTDGGAVFQPGAEEVTVPVRDRDRYAGYRVFGTGNDAVLLRPDVAHQLRSAAEFATQEGRITGGLLFGRGWVDDDGAYLVVDGFLQAGPGENANDRLSEDADNFTLSASDLRLLRADAARMYSSELEVGWWRTRAALGDFGPLDFQTQAQLVGPDGVGLLIYGTGVHWGTAYLGPEGLAPDSAGTLVAASPFPAPDAPPPAAPHLPGAPMVSVVEPAPEPSRPAAEPHLVDIAAGERLDEQDEIPPTEVVPAQAPPPGAVFAPPGRRRARPRVRMPSRVRAVRVTGPADGGYEPVGAALPETPGDVQLVVILLAVAVVAVAVIIGILFSSAWTAIIIAALGLGVLASTVWFSRR